MQNLDRSGMRKRLNWIWAAVIAAFAIAFLMVLSNPSGDTEALSNEEPTIDVDVMVPATVPDTPVDEMAAPEDDLVITRIEDEKAAEASASTN